MEERFNQPKVFLSHSKKNIEFIDRLARDLPKYQIKPWLDTDQIRHGKSWQDSIFEYGLPTCDAVIVYLTEFSIQSQVVKKEIDVALLQNLSDNNIAFLPYVSDEKLRTELRPDIRALQVPEWNDENYEVLLPRVVSEIWLSYLERTVSAAIKNEQLKRVQAELELEKYKSQPDDVFSKSENKEFEFILNSFDRKIPFEFSRHVIDDSEGTRRLITKHSYKCLLHLSTYIALLSDYYREYGGQDLSTSLVDEVRVLMDINNPDSPVNRDRVHDVPDFRNELLTHGLIERFTFTVIDEYRSENLRDHFQLSKKYFRYRFWLAYHQKLPDRLFIEIEK